uniref:Wsv216-like protein n=1 Tax=Trachysalambria curvirostris nimavirus TaxID=2984282 RepID=A0A9C7BWX4_9VIRU|nr:MAG: wsv216-like protein [Trachysalambria curvirostris nimavirus]
MSLHSTIIDVFGSSWGVFEFVCLLTIVTIVSFLGVQVIQSNFTRDGRTGKLKNSLGGDARAIYDAFARALDTSAANSASRLQSKENESQTFAAPDVVDTIRRYAENEIEARGTPPSQELVARVMKRTAEQIGLKVRVQDTGELIEVSRLLGQRQGEEEAVTPFKTVDIRLYSGGTSSQASSSVKITIIDGVLPESISLPLYMRVRVKRDAMDEEREKKTERQSVEDVFPELATSYWPPRSSAIDSGGESHQRSGMVFDDIYVDSLTSGILIYYDNRGSGASLFSPHSRISIEIEAYISKENRSRVLLFRGTTRVGSPLPELKEIVSCKNLIVLRIEDLTSPHHKMVHYPEETLSKKYVTEYPHHMPELTREAAEATDAFTRVVDNVVGPATHASDDRARGEAETENVLRRPAVAFIYGNGTSVDTLTHDLYTNIIKPGLRPDKYTTLPAERIGVMRDPSRPSDRYMCISVARTSVPAGAILIGWVVGFQDTGAFSRDGGFNIVFPAERSKEGYSDLFFDELSATVSGDRKVVLHNTDNYVGCFGDDEDLPLPSKDLLQSWDGPVNGERYFSYHLRPCVLVRQRAGTPPDIAAIMCSPATEYAGQKTGLLPRRLAISGGPLPLIQEDRDQLPLFDVVIQGGGPVTLETDKDPERLWAIFPTLRTKTRLVNEIDLPYAPLNNLLSRNRTSILSVHRLVMRNSDGGHAVLRAFDEKSGTTLGRAIVPISNGLATPSVLFADCARDDRSISIDAVIFGCDDKQMPVRLPGNLSGQFLEMTAPDNDYQLWHKPGSFRPHPELITLSPHRTTVIICRTTHPPITDAGTREPFRKLSGLVPFPPITPRWAFVGSINNKFPRHIFISSVRNSDTVNTISKSDGKPFSVGEWLRENLCLPITGDKTSNASKEYVDGQRAYARMYLGPEVTDMALDQILDGDNRACVVSENGTVKETLLKNDACDGSRLVGDWGIAVFGSNPHPSEPADRFSVWRTAGRLHVVWAGVAQPVTPLQNSLSTWPNGDPVVKTRDGETLLRLDPRIGGVCSANGLYNVVTSDPSKMTSSLLMVVIKSETGMVLYARRLPLWCKVVDRESENKITDGLRQVDRGSAAQRRLWNRTTFDNDELILCVRMPIDIHKVQGTVVIVDHLIFACSASVTPASARDQCYQRFVSGNPDDVLFDDSLREGFSLSVPKNFSTVCGFTL